MIIDPSGRGPTMRQLMLAGVALFLVIALAITLLMMRYLGTFTSKVPVVAELTTTGDGLPANADVKFRGLFVGTVSGVEVKAQGEVQKVSIDLKPKWVDGIPDNVTARVVPSTVFGVTSVELLEHGPAPHIEENATIAEDKSKETIALQDTLTTLRDILNAIDPLRLGRVLSSLADALDGSGRVPGSTIERLDHVLTALDEATPDLGSDLRNFSNAAGALNQSAPELIDVLGSSLQTARTISEKREQLVSMLATAGGTVDTTNALFARNPNAGKDVVDNLNVNFGALASDPDAVAKSIPALADTLQKISTSFVWNFDGPIAQPNMPPGQGFPALTATVTFTPFQPYTRETCPRYGDMAGPSCETAPLFGDPGELPPELMPRALGSPAAAAAAPAIPGVPSLPGLPNITLPTIPGLPTPAAETPPAPTLPNPFAGTPLEKLFPPAPQPAAAVAPAPAAPEQPTEPGAVRPASFKGLSAVTALLGKRPNVTQMILLGGGLTGATLQVAPTASAPIQKGSDR